MSDGHVQVAIIGAGPAGLTLAWLLHQAGIGYVIFERQSREYVEGRIRAGILEHASVETLIAAGAGERLRREGLTHDGVSLAFAERQLRIDFRALTGRAVTVYGQTEITRDLNVLHAQANSRIFFQSKDVSVHLPDPTDLHSSAQVRGHHNGESIVFDCDYVAGCDGFHGISRTAIPATTQRNFERVYDHGWLGVLSDTPPVSDELIYANHARGFALCSMRSTSRSRYYVQVGCDESLEGWSDDRFWQELSDRLPAATASRLITGPSIEKSIAPLRSFVTEPMRYGRLFLAGDAAHIVPPTGAKGLNLALGDVSALAAAFIAYFGNGSTAALDTYSQTRLARVWQVVRFSWWFTQLTHRFSDDFFQQRLQIAELEHLANSRAAQTALAENYVGLD